MYRVGRNCKETTRRWKTRSRPNHATQKVDLLAALALLHREVAWREDLVRIRVRVRVGVRVKIRVRVRVRVRVNGQGQG